MPPPSQTGLSYRETVKAIATCLEVSIHTILYLRSVYPAHTFIQRKAYNVPVYQSRSPQVIRYISRIIDSCIESMDIGVLKRLIVLVRSKEGFLTLEKFVLDFGYMSLDEMNDNAQKEARIRNAPDEREMSIMLRDFMAKFNAMDSWLQPVECDKTFSVILDTVGGVQPPGKSLDQSLYWVPALEKDNLNPQKAHPDEPEPIQSVKSIVTGVIDMRLVVQECAAKSVIRQRV